MLLVLTPLKLSAQAHDGFFPVPGARIFFRDSGGNGVPVVFLHAASGNSDAWEAQIPAFTAAGYRVIAYDRRGWGRTVDEPNAEQAWTQTGDLSLLVNHLRIDRFHLVATALGGYVGYDFALSYPDRLRSAVIANSLGGFQDEKLLALSERLRPKGLSGMPADFIELGPAYRASNPDGVKRWLEREKNSRHSAKSGTPLQHRLTLDLAEAIDTPMLLLTGGADLIVPPTFQNTIAAHIRHAETLVVPNAGHAVFWEEPAAFNRAVLAFIGRR